MRIKRSQVIEALRTEPLQAGSFFHTTEQINNGENPNLKTCKVCAVGAVLRKTGLINKMDEEDAVELILGIDHNGAVICIPDDLVNYHEENLTTRQGVNQLLKDRKYFSALSVYFEAMAETNRGIRRHRLVDFVKRTFPSTITVK